MAKNRIAKPQSNFWQPAWNNYSKHAGFMFCFCRLLFVDFLRVLCSLYNYVMNKNLYLAQGVLLEHFGKGTFHLKYKERKLSSCFIFEIFKIWTQTSHRMWKTRLQVLSRAHLEQLFQKYRICISITRLSIYDFTPIICIYDFT